MVEPEPPPPLQPSEIRAVEVLEEEQTYQEVGHRTSTQHQVRPFTATRMGPYNGHGLRKGGEEKEAHYGMLNVGIMYVCEDVYY